MSSQANTSTKMDESILQSYVATNRLNPYRSPSTAFEAHIFSECDEIRSAHDTIGPNRTTDTTACTANEHVNHVNVSSNSPLTQVGVCVTADLHRHIVEMWVLALTDFPVRTYDGSLAVTVHCSPCELDCIASVREPWSSEHSKARFTFLKWSVLAVC